MTEPTDRDREMAIAAWLRSSCMVTSAFVIMDLANQFAAAREEGRLAEREKWIVLAGPYWRTGREISPLAFLAATRLEAIEECRRRLDFRINDLLNETWPDHDDSIVGINQAWAVADALFEEMK